MLTPDEYGVYRDQWRNLQPKDGKIIHISKQDMADILEMADDMVRVYLSLPYYDGLLKMNKPIPPQLATKDMLEDMIVGV